MRDPAPKDARRTVIMVMGNFTMIMRTESSPGKHPGNRHVQVAVSAARAVTFRTVSEICPDCREICYPLGSRREFRAPQSEFNQNRRAEDAESIAAPVLRAFFQ